MTAFGRDEDTLGFASVVEVDLDFALRESARENPPRPDDPDEALAAVWTKHQQFVTAKDPIRELQAHGLDADAAVRMPENAPVQAIGGGIGDLARGKGGRPQVIGVRAPMLVRATRAIRARRLQTGKEFPTTKAADVRRRRVDEPCQQVQVMTAFVNGQSHRSWGIVPAPHEAGAVLDREVFGNRDVLNLAKRAGGHFLLDGTPERRVSQHETDMNDLVEAAGNSTDKFGAPGTGWSPAASR